MTVVHQLLPAAAPGDAVTDQAFAWRGLLAGWGIRARSSPSTSTPTSPARYLASTALAGCSSWEASRSSVIRSGARGRLALLEPGNVALCYHNITPGDQLRQFNPGSQTLRPGPRTVASFRPAGPAHRRFLVQRGTLVRPGSASGRRAAAPRRASHSCHGVAPEGDPTVLSVGRIAPNKRARGRDQGICALSAAPRAGAPDW